MDNASAHTLSASTEKLMHGLKVRCLSHMTVIYLPPNTTSAIQPCDQGVIRSLKAGYRRLLVKWQYGRWKELKALLDARGLEQSTTVQTAPASGSGHSTAVQTAPTSGSGRLGSLMAYQMGAGSSEGSTPTPQKRGRQRKTEKPLPWQGTSPH